MKTNWNNFKLGRIKQGKLVGFDGEMLWNFDVTFLGMVGESVGLNYENL